MKTNTNNTQESRLSALRVCRLRVQGYEHQSEAELNDLAFGHRLTFRICLVVSGFAVITANLYLLAIMVGIAFLGIVLPYHPFDYFYNLVVRKWVNDKPRLPQRSMQLKFSCIMAVPWLGGVIYFFQSGQMIAGYILGALLMTSAFLVGFLDLCIPSMIYNALFLKKTKPIKVNS